VPFNGLVTVFRTRRRKSTKAMGIEHFWKSMIKRKGFLIDFNDF